MKSSSRILELLPLALVAAWMPAAAQPPAQRADAVPARAEVAAAGVPAERLQRPGLPRFGKVTNQLYRGGQPDNRGFAELKALGVRLVVNLRNEPDEIARERTVVESLGLRYASIPWRGKENPRIQQVAEFLDLLRANADGAAFVHCERGAERTGVMIASYRMSAERWTAQQALDEMDLFGFRRFGFAHLKRFVREFPTLLTRDPLLRQPGS